MVTPLADALLRYASQATRSCRTSVLTLARNVDRAKSITKVSFMKVELVTTLKRQATRLLKEVREGQEPILITEHGRPSAYLIDVESFEKEKEKLKLFEGLARGEEAIRRGRTLNQKEAKERLKKWLR